MLKANLKRGEMVFWEDQHGIVILKWKDTRDVRLLSTKHARLMISVSKINPEINQPIPSTSSVPEPQASTSRSDFPESFNIQEPEEETSTVPERKRKSCRKAYGNSGL